MRSIQFFIVFILCVVPFGVRASGSLEISEIMYDPSGTDTNREWVEVHNTSDSNASLVGVTFATDGVASTHHSLAPVSGSTIPALGYAVLVQNADAFTKDYPGYAGLIFDSSWTGLTTSTPKTLVLFDQSGDISDQVTYNPSLGGSNDGNSLQKNSTGSWVASTPTPGASLGVESPIVLDDESDSTTSVTTTSTPQSNVASFSQTKTVEKAHLVLTVPKTGVSGIPVAMNTQAFGDDGSARSIGSFYVSFGDGSADDGTRPRSLTHTYIESGTYIVVYEYRFNPNADDPDLVTRSTIEITDPEVSLTITSAKSIRLTNTNTRELDVSGWRIVDTAQKATFNFTLPRGTKILAGHTIQIPTSVSAFAGPIDTHLVLELPSGIVVRQGSVATRVSQNTTASQSTVSKSTTKKKKTLHTSVSATANEDISKPDVSESAPQTHSFIPYILGCIGIVVGASIALVRSKFFDSKKTASSDDIQIIE